MRDNTLIIKRLLILIMKADGPILFSDICNKLSIQSNELKEIIYDLNKSGIRDYFKLNFYDASGEDIDDIELINNENLDDIEFEIDISFGTKFSNIISGYSNLSNMEELQLYSLLKNDKSNFIYSEKKKVIELLDADNKQNYKALENRVIMKNTEVDIESYEQILISCYKFITKGELVNICTNKITLVNCLLTKVIYDRDSLSWVLQYVRRGKFNYIRLDKIIDINQDDIRFLKPKEIDYRRLNKNARGNWGVGKKRIVKFRVYHEDNAKEKALRYILKKKVKIEIKDKHTDFTLQIEDTSLFLRWVRSMGASAIILEPEDLRNKVIAEVNEWQKKYI